MKTRDLRNAALMVSAGAGALLVTAISPAEAALDYMYFQSGWQTAPPISPHNYTALTADAARNYTVYAAGPGRLDEVNFSGGWNVNPINNNTYTDVVADAAGAIQELYGARSGGGLDYIWFQSGSWNQMSLSNNTYVSLAARKVQPNNIVAARAGALDNVYFSSGWHVDTISNVSYSEIISDRAGAGEEYYAARAGGGLDYIYFQGGWQTQSLSANTYVSLTPDYTRQNNFFGARAGGGLDNIAFYAGSWHVDPVNNNQYVSITVNEGDSGQSLFGALANGGVHHIYFQGGWQTTLVNNNQYLALVGDRGTGGSNVNEFYGAQIPEPASLGAVMVGALTLLRRARQS